MTKRYLYDIIKISKTQEVCFMEEKVLSNKKNGMSVLLLTLLGLAAAIGCIILGGVLLDSGRVLGAPFLVIGLIGVIGSCIIMYLHVSQRWSSRSLFRSSTFVS